MHNAVADDCILISSVHALLDLHEDVVEEVLEDAQDLLLRVVVILDRLQPLKRSSKLDLTILYHLHL